MKYHLTPVITHTHTHTHTNLTNREFPGRSVVRTWHFHCWSPGWIPDRGSKSLQAMGVAKKKKKSTNNRCWRM